MKNSGIRRLVGLCAIYSLAIAGASAAQEWPPVRAPLMTRWAGDVSPAQPHPEYPRPQLERAEWLNLNGLWDYSIEDVTGTPRGAVKDKVPNAGSGDPAYTGTVAGDGGRVPSRGGISDTASPAKNPSAARAVAGLQPPSQYQGKILVPFPIESALSGVMKRLSETNRLWYRRTFQIPAQWAGRRVRLHFGAVDWECAVWLNDKLLGQHRGGYDGFSFDITDALRTEGSQEIRVAVSDPTDAGSQPRGKQVRNPHGIWYTPSSGIWQTVWLEPLGAAYVDFLRITPNLDAAAVTFDASIQAPAGTRSTTLLVDILEAGQIIQQAEISTLTTTSAPPRVPLSMRLTMAVPHPRPWSPDQPFLYDARLTVYQDGAATDRLTTYFGLRKISIGKDEKGMTRLMLNNEPLFQFGPLDQGFWPDGLYTAPTDEALRFDIEMTRQLGFNTARKHVKIEPDRWYYWCDKLGLIVWQDMPSARPRTPEDQRQFEAELRAMVAGLFNHPSIVMWVPFNEGWGQYDTERIVELTRQLDPSRLVNNASGWTDKKVGDVLDIHSYPGPSAPPPEPARAGVLGEFGGLGLPLRGHTWQDEKNWGYRSFADPATLTAGYLGLIRKLRPLIGSHGLSAAIYTQTTDVEIEVNGLLTYDRAQVKPDGEAIARANRSVYLPPPPPPVIREIIPTSQKTAATWRYSTSPPPPQWSQPGFDDAEWKSGPAGFGAANTPGAVVRTEWKTPGLWLRRTVNLPADFPRENLHWMIHHDEDAELFVNGQPAAALAGYTTDYEPIPVSAAAVSALRPGPNLLAVHCRQTGGGQYIDVGLAAIADIADAAPPAAPAAGQPAQIRSALTAVAERRDGLYVAPRAPIQPAPFLKLPPGAVQPRGWLRHMLELERDGMIGRLQEISPWLRFDQSAWARPDGSGERGWEELPYWLKGYGDLGYVLDDASIIAETRRWIEAVMASQREDGYFGPQALLAGINGKPDLWPHMVMLNILQSYYEYTADPRAIRVMTRYCAWQNLLPASAFGEGYWPRIRAGDNIESVHWLYHRTGHPWLLELASKIHHNMARWDQDIINWHNVNIAQGFRAPAMFYVQSRDPILLYAAERNYRKILDLYGQFPGGTFAGDENCRPGFTDPRQGFETCGIVEFMHSFELLGRISGNPVWSDRCEEIAFNSFPAALTPDLKGLHYLTCANQVQLDRHNKSPGIQNRGTMFSYSPFEVYRCCQHNVSHGWPFFAEELWLATWDRGLAASLYAASEVRARVGPGIPVQIAEETDYPFDDLVRLRLSTPQPVAFPLYLRVPGWSGRPAVKINGQSIPVSTAPPSWLVVHRTWQNGDVLTLEFSRQITLRRWAKNQNAVSVDHGPLTFALEIQERWQPYGQRNGWTEWEVLPGSAWNYGLALNADHPAGSFEVVRQRNPLPAQPFTPSNAPIRLKVNARKIPAWQTDPLGLVGKLQPSPARSTEPLETVTLIPMGAARLRISSFPTIGTGPAAHEWIAPPQARRSAFRISASHCYENDTVDALDDGLEPSQSGDQAIPRFTWWDRQGTTEWVQFDFDKPRPVTGVSVYWFDDTGVGQCRVPASWRVLHRVGEEWRPVEPSAGFGVQADAWNQARFTRIETQSLRLEARLQTGFSAGILEWKILGNP
ncbi:MAG: glycoside hydrolase family 127 protein [Verrucomicrobia bacterium]|nr:glycoside hydrolase family 127 protein [Verrucomicrobiota bacterium]